MKILISSFQLKYNIFIILLLLLLTSVLINYCVSFEINSSEHISLNKCKQFSSTIIRNNSNAYFINIRDSNLIFRLAQEESELECKNNNGTNLFTFMANIQGIQETQKNETTIEIDSNFTAFGQLRIDDDYYNIEEYCIKRLSDKDITLDVCQPSCDGKNTLCLPKCCSIGKSLAFTEFGQGCLESGPIVWTPSIHQNPYTKVSQEQMNSTRKHYVHTKPNCSSYNTWPLRNLNFDGEIVPKVPWRFLNDGRLVYLGKSRTWSKLPNNINYCIDGLITNYELNQNYSGLEVDQVLIICSPDEENSIVTRSISYLYVAIMLIASTFLFITAIIYILLWDSHTIHGWTIFCQVSSMFFMYVFLTAAHILGNTKTDSEESGSVLCIGIGILAHFFFLSTFCWMTLLNFDLFWTFRVLRPQGSGKTKGIKRFYIFLTFAWTLPIIVIATGLILNAEFPDIESEIIVPEYGTTTCFISKTALGPYLYYIIGVLLGCNLILMFITTSGIYRLKKSTSGIVQVGKNSKDQQTFKLIAKLFIIMGITWLFEFFSWLDTNTSGGGTYGNNVEADPSWYWILLDIINIFQAIAIFIIFICKRKIWIQLQTKYGIIEKLAPKCIRIKTNKNNSNNRNANGSNDDDDNDKQTRNNDIELEQNSCNSNFNSNSTKFTDDSRSNSVKSSK